MNATLPNPRRLIVMLMLTEYCNLDCVYCYEKYKSKSVMSIGTAKESVQKFMAESEGFDEVEFDLFGGEPTLRKNIIIELVEWTIAKKYSKPFLFFLQTNGTLINDKFKSWLLRHRSHVVVGLSLDGTRETHNANRSNSYDLIDIGFFRDNYADQGVRMTISPNGIETLSRDVIHLHESGFSRVDSFFCFRC